MPKLHVIYDRDGRLQNTLPNDKFGVAIMDISDELTGDEIKQVLEEIGTILIEQMTFFHD